MLWSEFVHACTEMKSLQVKPPACPFPRFAGYQSSLSFLLCGVGKAERKRGLKGRNSFVYLSPLPTDRTEFCSVFIDTQTWKQRYPHLQTHVPTLSPFLICISSNEFITYLSS